MSLRPDPWASVLPAEPRMPGALREELSRIVAMVWPTGVGTLGFELDLNSDCHTVDFAMRLGRGEVGQLEALCHAIGSEVSVLRRELFSRVVRFARHWGAGGAPHRGIGQLWVECDARSVRQRDRAGIGLFFGRHPDAKSGEWVRERQADIAVITGRRIDGGVRKNLDDVVKHLRNGATPKQIGCFVGRARRAVRLCIGGLDVSALPELLRAIDYRGTLRSAVGDLQRVRTATTSLLAAPGLTHIDCGREGIGDSIGIEVTFEFVRQFTEGKLDTGALDVLVDMGLATPEARSIVCAWPGVVHAPSCCGEAIVRRVSHVKLVYRAERVVQAKGYFGFRRGVPSRHGTL